MDRKEGKMITADELNSIEPFKIIGKGSPTIDIGQIWTVDSKITSWLPIGSDIPPLFPVVISGINIKVGDMSVCNVIPAHDFTGNGAEDDLFCSKEDQPINDCLLACWAECQIFTSHLSDYLGNLSLETSRYLDEIMDTERTIRERTGTPIIQALDPRKEFRNWFREQTAVLSIPVKRYASVLNETEP